MNAAVNYDFEKSVKIKQDELDFEKVKSFNSKFSTGNDGILTSKFK